MAFTLASWILDDYHKKVDTNAGHVKYDGAIKHFSVYIISSYFPWFLLHNPTQDGHEHHSKACFAFE